MTRGCEWRHVPEACGEDFGRFKKSELVEILPRKKTVDFRGSPKPGQWPCGTCRTWFGADGKVSIERLHLSPYVEKTFNSKIIKSFVPEIKSRKCFSCFGIPTFYVYMLWTFYVHFTYSCMTMLHLSLSLSLYIYIYIYTHTHTHIYIYIYIKKNW